MDTHRSTSAGKRLLTAAIGTALAFAGLGLPAAALAEEGAEPAAETPAETPAALPYQTSLLTAEAIAADAALAAQAQSAELTGVTVSVTNDAAAASQLYDALDALRAQAGLEPLARDGALELAACQRAAELTLLDANMRPDGTLFPTASSGRASAEIVAVAPASAALDAQTLAGNLTDEEAAAVEAATNVGVAVVTDAAGASYWALELSADAADGGAAAMPDGAAVYRVAVASANVAAGASSAAVSVEAGSTATAPMPATVSGTIAYGSAAAAFTASAVSLDPVAYTWNSSDPAVATVDVNGTIAGVGNGTCVVSAADASNNQFIYNVTVTGGQPAASMTDLADCTVAGILGSYEATGAAIAPAFSVIDPDNGNVDPGQYTYVFSDNVEPGTATLTITANPGSTVLTGQTTKTFEIVASQPVTVAVPSVAGLAEADAEAALAAAGLAASPVEGEAAPDEASAGLAYGTDPAEGTAVPVGSGVTLYYYGAAGAPQATDISAATVTVSPSPAIYTGEAVTPAVSVAVTAADGSQALLVQDVDYTVAYGNNIELTTPEAPATVTVTGIGAYTGTAAASFQIIQQAATTADLAQAGFSVSPIATQPYTGQPVTPAVTLSGPSTLVEGQDYTVAFASNMAPGTATVTVTGAGAYTGTLAATFLIQADISAAEVSGLAALPYTGAPLTPSPVVTFAGQVLEAGTDYDIAYANNVNVGTATITITGKGAFSGVLSPVFTIEAKSIKSAQIAPIAETTFTGGAITPAVSVTDGTAVLAAGTDYTVSYEQNVNAGTGHVVVTGAGNYRDSIDATFKISPVSMDRTTVVMPNMAYTGAALAPKPVSVTVGGIQLVEGVDYDIVGYADNTAVGNARVTLQGKGNFTGTVTADWKIVQQGASDTGTTQTMPRTGDETSIVAVVAAGVVGAAFVIGAIALIAHRSRKARRTR